MTIVSTRDRLIDTALDLFYRNGFHAVGLDRVIDGVGVTKTTFYNHFESKDDLVIATIKARDVYEREAMEQFMCDSGGDCPRARIMAIFDMLDAWFNDEEFRGCLFMNVAMEFPAPNDPAHQAAAEHTHKVEDLIRDLAAKAGADDPRALAREIMMIIEGAIVMRYVASDDDSAKIARDAAELLMERHIPTAV